MEARYDVIIAGTGPAGLTLANLLGAYGVRTLVLEKDGELSPLPKALNVDDEFFRLLHTLGLGPAMKAHAKYPISYDYVSPLGLNLGFVQGRITEHNFPNRAAIFQPEFEQILARHAEDSGFVEFVFDRELAGVEDDGERVTVTARNAEGELIRYTARYLVGADGAHSACRKLMGLSFQEVDKFDVRHVVIDVKDDIDPSARALTKMGWRRNFFSMPAPNGRRFEFSLQKHETAEQLLDDDMLRRLFKPWRNYDELQIIRKVVHTFRSRIAPQFQKGRIFLIGDAAHLMPVFGSQGMNSGARDANNLAWKLASVILHGASDRILHTYNEERWAAVLQSIKMATTSGKLQRVQSIPMSLLRDLVFGVLLRLVPPATRYIREMRYIPKPFLRSALIEAGAETGKPEEFVGRVAPNPTVVCDDRECLLDEVMGHGFAVIGLAPPQAELPDAQAIADGLDAKVVLLGHDNAPQIGATGAASSVLTARLRDDRYDPVWSRYQGQWLLVRPDRVIACAGPLEAFRMMAASVSQTLQFDLSAPAVVRAYA